MEKLILDACCGGRMFWFDKNHPRALYIDRRVAEPGHISLRPNHTVQPDEIVDFRDMPYSDGQFKLVVFDPPHMAVRNGKEGFMAKKYGSLNKITWRDDLAAGFKECWRVLAKYGCLIFKWRSSEIALTEVLKCFPERPLFGHTTNAKGNTHWICFMKIGNEN